MREEPQVPPAPTPPEQQEPEETTASVSAVIPASPVTAVPEPEAEQEMPTMPASVSEAVPTPPETPPLLPEAPQVPQTASAPAVAVQPTLPPAPAVVIPNPAIVSIDVRFDQVSAVDQRPVGLLLVEVEETLGHYAEWAGVRTQQIRHLNGLRFGRTLHLHQKIKIPLDKTNAAAFEEQRYEYHKRLQEDFFAAYRVTELESYRVEQGDNYWTLCREKFGVPMWLLKHYNMDVDLADLHIHQKLMIPAIQETAAGDPGTVSNDTAPETDPSEVPEDDPEPVPPEETPAR
jgi:membrane-bound lytic murein transglycosylase D